MRRALADVMTSGVKGDVYSRIVNEVIDSSRVDFEENGVDPVTLEELKTVSAPPFAMASLWPELFSLSSARGPWRPSCVFNGKDVFASPPSELLSSFACWSHFLALVFSVCKADSASSYSPFSHLRGLPLGFYLLCGTAKSACFSQ